MRTSLPSPNVPPWLRHSAAVAGRLLVLTAAVWVVAVLAAKLTVVVVPLLVALLLAGVLAPLARRAQRRGAPDWAAPLALVLLLLLAAIGLVAALGASIAEQIPQLTQQIGSAADRIGQRLGVDLRGLLQRQQGGGGGGGGQQAASGALVAAKVLFGFFLTLVLTFFLLKDGRQMWSWFLSHVGAELRANVDAAGRAAWQTLGSYVRGLTVVALFDAVGIAVGLLLLGVPLVITLAVLQFIASYIPTIGAIVAGAVAVAVAFVHGGLVTAGLTLLLIVVVQQIGNDVVEPWVMGRTLGLHPMVILLAVTAGGVLWGVAGALLFVPLSAAVNAAASVIWQRRQGEAGRPAG